MTAWTANTVDQLHLNPAHLLAFATETEVRSNPVSSRTAPREDRVTSDRDQLLVEQLSLVRVIARRIHARLPQHVELEDLVSAGTVGLMEALEKFDSNRSVQFRSYAQFRVRGAILDSLRNLDWSPRDLRRKARVAQATIETLTQQMGRVPADSEIAAEMEMSLSDYHQLLTDVKGLEIGSLNVERNDASGDDELAYVPGPADEDPLFHCLRGEMRQRLGDSLEELPERERMVMMLYYFEELTMKEIGLVLRVVESRVSQMHSSAVLRLRAGLAVKNLKGKKQPHRSS